MTDKRMVILRGPEQRRLAKDYADEVPDGWVVRFSPPEKTRDQEEKYHAMIGDIAKQCPFMGETLDREDMKRLLVDAFVRVMREMAKAEGRPDPFGGQGRLMPNLDGTGFVQLGVQTRRFTKNLGSEFIEYLAAYGAERNVRWSAASQDAMQPVQPLRRVV
jgi:hypothetical protein